MNRTEKINSLTPVETENCLNCLLKSFAEEDELFRDVVASEDSSTLRSIALEIVGEGYSQRLSRVSARDPHVIQTLLMTMADDPNMSERLDGCLEQRRKLIEPITTALVMAGLVLLLKSRISLKYEIKDGKKHFIFSFDKQPSREKFAFFLCSGLIRAIQKQRQRNRLSG